MLNTKLEMSEMYNPIILVDEIVGPFANKYARYHALQDMHFAVTTHSIKYKV